MAVGTARKPAARKVASSQPRNFDGTLSHQSPVSGPPGIGRMSFSTKLSSTAFLSHWWTYHSPPTFSATRARPASRSASACSTASRISPPVSNPSSSRRSQASSMMASMPAMPRLPSKGSRYEGSAIVTRSLAVRAANCRHARKGFPKMSDTCPRREGILPSLARRQACPLSSRWLVPAGARLAARREGRMPSLRGHVVVRR